MSYNQDVNLAFRPFKAGDFSANTPIVAGAQATSPYKRGVTDMAYNQLTLLANLRRPLILHSPRPEEATVVLTTATTVYEIAAYKYRIPAFTGNTRRFLRVRVRGYISAGTWTPGGKTGTNQVTAGTSGNTVSSEIEFNVDTGTSGDDYFMLQVQTNTNGATFTLESLHVYLLPITTEDTGTGLDITRVDAIHPIDSTVQAIEDRPLTVDVVRDLALTNKTLQAENKGAVVNFCTIARYGSLWTGSGDTQATTGRFISLDETDDDGFRRVWEWLYFPRDITRQLTIHLDGYVPGWASGADVVNIRFNFLDMDGEVLTTATGAIDKATYFSSEAWAMDGTQIEIPPGSGPFRLEMRARSFVGAGDVAKITAISIYET